MLDSLVTMKRVALVFVLLLLMVRPVAAQTATAPSPAITSPAAGQAVQGIVTVSGTSAATGFASAELAFAYAGDPTGTWFVIAASTLPVSQGTLATWDTTTITDGNYNLRLRVSLADGTFSDVLVGNLRVRNYTPVETPTPVPTSPQAPTPTPTPTITPTATPYPTPTQLPPNPAEIAPADVWVSVGYGGVAAMALILLLGAYLWLRRK